MKGIHHIDLVVEVRDARIPLTCINTFDSFTEREKLIIYNKSDLANPQMKLPLLKGTRHIAHTTLYWTIRHIAHPL